MQGHRVEGRLAEGLAVRPCTQALCTLLSPIRSIRRAYERHFKEYRHQNGMRAMGIPNNKNFFEVTKIDDALALWRDIQSKQKGGFKVRAWLPMPLGGGAHPEHGGGAWAAGAKRHVPVKLAGRQVRAWEPELIASWRMPLSC